MGKLVVLIAVGLVISVPAFAESTGSTAIPSHGSHSHTIPDSAFVDNNTVRDEFGYGIGADVVLYKPAKYGIDEVVAEARYDVGRQETTVMAVVRIDPWKAFTKDVA